MAINHKLLRELRERRCLKQIDIAKILGFNSSSSISKIESGERDLKIDKLIVLAKFYNVSVDELLIK